MTPRPTRCEQQQPFKCSLSFIVPIVYELTLNFQKRVRKITPKILQLLTEWTETFPYDFRDERMMRSLKELTHRLASGEEVSVSSLESLAADVSPLIRGVMFWGET